ncbi:MAG: nuclear transport factor 2 family protein [Candidatus Dormibacteraceae bacterium]
MTASGTSVKKQYARSGNQFFHDSTRAAFETEAMVVAGDRAAVRWRFDWGDGHIRGIDLFKVRNGSVAEKLSYVKG